MGLLFIICYFTYYYCFYPELDFSSLSLPDYSLSLSSFLGYTKPYRLDIYYPNNPPKILF